MIFLKKVTNLLSLADVAINALQNQIKPFSVPGLQIEFNDFKKSNHFETALTQCNAALEP